MKMTRRKKIILVLLLTGFFLLSVRLKSFLQRSKEEDLPKIYEHRRRNVDKVCKDYRSKLEEDYKKYFPEFSYHSVVSKVDLLFKTRGIGKRFLWCRVPKASSQSWNDLFMRVWFSKNIFSTPGRQQVLLRRYWTLWFRHRKPKFLYNTNDKIFSFLVSRHPFERILSAYRDKFFLNNQYSTHSFEKTKVEKFRRLYGKEIISKYRTAVPDDPKYKDAPTFREFILYLLDLPLEKFDPHWLPVYYQCLPCHIKYTILARIDSMTEDSEEILRRIGIGNYQLPFTHVTGNQTSDKMVEQFYSQLDLHILHKLYELYEMDFLLFGYSPDTFYKYFNS